MLEILRKELEGTFPVLWYIATIHYLDQSHQIKDSEIKKASSSAYGYGLVQLSPDRVQRRRSYEYSNDL
jgi:hypothetical protein